MTRNDSITRTSVFSSARELYHESPAPRRSEPLPRNTMKPLLTKLNTIQLIVLIKLQPLCPTSSANKGYQLERKARSSCCKSGPRGLCEMQLRPITPPLLDPTGLESTLGDSQPLTEAHSDSQRLTATHPARPAAARSLDVWPLPVDAIGAPYGCH